MISFLALLLIIWAMIFSAVRCVRYFRIVSEYKDRTEAVVDKFTLRPIKNKREGKNYDVVLKYEINGKKDRSQIVVPSVKMDEFKIGQRVMIRYKVSENGTVHIASDNDMLEKMMKGHAFAVAIEFIAFIVIWWNML